MLNTYCFHLKYNYKQNSTSIFLLFSFETYYICDNLPLALPCLNRPQGAPERNWALRAGGRLTTGIDIVSWITRSKTPKSNFLVGFGGSWDSLKLLQEISRDGFRQLTVEAFDNCRLSIGNHKYLLKVMLGTPIVLSLIFLMLVTSPNLQIFLN